MSTTSRVIAVLIAGVTGLGCAPASPEEPGAVESSGKEGAALSSSTTVGDWSLFPDYRQCIVGVQEFYPARFSTWIPSMPDVVTGDCAEWGACHLWVDAQPDPAVWERIPDGSGLPATYDIAVYPPKPGNPYGHVGSVDHVEGGQIFIMDDNFLGDERRAPSPHTVDRAPYGWYHLRSLPGGGGVPGGGAGNGCHEGGRYCGGDVVSGDPGTLYVCQGGQAVVAAVCDNGCQVNPAPINDACY